MSRICVCVCVCLFSLIVSDAAVRAAELVSLHITHTKHPTLRMLCA